MNFNFGSNTPKTTASTSTPTNPATTTAAFSLGTSASAGLSFGATPSSTPGFSLGGAGDSSKPTTTSSTTGQVTAAVKPMAAATTLATTPFSLGATPATTTSTAVSSTTFSGFGLTPTTTAAAPQTTTTGFSFGALTTTTAAAFSLTTSTTVTPSALKPGVTTTGLTTMATTTVSSAPAASTTTPTISFVQLEESLNKWTLELEEQEKIFISQAAQINNWDKLLNSNSDKIVALNEEVATLRLQQQQLGNELDFIVAQQRELEEVLAPLEKQVAEVPANTDPEREHLYHMAENLDSQVKQMSEDLREVIEHLNESNRTQDNSDPIVQIGRILNAHMGSLQWIDQMTLNIQNQLENVTKLHDIHRRENERSFRISYE